MKIVPAILETDFNEIENKIDSVLMDTDKIHIDICDGLFVSNKTWPYSQSSNNRILDNFHIKNILNENIGLPHWDKIDYEFDLMIQNPDLTKDIWGRVGANILIIHPTSFKNNQSIIDFVYDMKSYIIDIIFAVTYDEYFIYEDLIKELLSNGLINVLQIMTIKIIGLQGQSFDNRNIDLIKKIISENPNIYIKVDGGINEKNINKLIDLGVKEYVMGSSVFAYGNPRENLNYFKDLC